VRFDLYSVGVIALLQCSAPLLPFSRSPFPQQGGGSTPSKPLVPIAASTLSANPDPYYGQHVTLTGAVEQLLSRSAFSVDQDKTQTTGHDILILAPTMNSAVAPNSYVTVIGEVVRFDPAEIGRMAKDYVLDLTPDLVEKFRGRPAVLASSVIDAKMVDVAKRPPPPLTAEEEAYDKIMKRIGPAFTALRQAAAGSDATAAAGNTTVLKQSFTEVERFWKPRGKADAMQWAQDARKQVESIERALAGGKWEEAKTSVGSLGQTCQSCHGTYRERLDDRTYRIKPLVK
jgi:hypothetical protein